MNCPNREKTEPLSPAASAILMIYKTTRKHYPGSDRGCGRMVKTADLHTDIHEQDQLFVTYDALNRLYQSTAESTFTVLPDSENILLLPADLAIIL